MNSIRDTKFIHAQEALSAAHDYLSRLDHDALLVRLDHDADGIEPGTVQAAAFARLRRLAVAGKAFAEAGKREGGPQ